MKLAAPQNVAADVGGDKALTITAEHGVLTGVLISVKPQAFVIRYVFLAAKGTDSTSLPNPIELARAAATKPLAAGSGPGPPAARRQVRGRPRPARPHQIPTSSATAITASR